MQAFTTDFRIHWAQHPLRPEFVESTYFIYKVSAIATLALLLLPFPITDFQVICIINHSVSNAPDRRSKKLERLSSFLVRVFSCTRNWDGLEHCSILYEKLGVT